MLRVSSSPLNVSLPHPQEDVLLFAGWGFAIGHHHVLGVLKGPTVQEEDAFRRLLLLQTVQHNVHTKTWRGTNQRGDSELSFKLRQTL